MINRVQQLAKDPTGRGTKQLKGQSILWAARVGDLRVVYEIDDEAEVIYIEAIGNRDNIYEIVRRLR